MTEPPSKKQQTSGAPWFESMHHVIRSLPSARVSTLRPLHLKHFCCRVRCHVDLPESSSLTDAWVTCAWAHVNTDGCISSNRIAHCSVTW